MKNPQTKSDLLIQLSVAERKVAKLQEKIQLLKDETSEISFLDLVRTNGFLELRNIHWDKSGEPGCYFQVAWGNHAFDLEEEITRAFGKFGPETRISGVQLSKHSDRYCNLENLYYFLVPSKRELDIFLEEAKKAEITVSFEHILGIQISELAQKTREIEEHRKILGFLEGFISKPAS